jgi:hypothetical protein
MGSLIGVLLLVGFLAKFWWLIPLLIAAVAAYRYVWRASVRQQAALDAEAAEKTTIAARADQQHAWGPAGDERGAFGTDYTSLDTEG